MPFHRDLRTEFPVKTFILLLHLEKARVFRGFPANFRFLDVLDVLDAHWPSWPHLHMLRPMSVEDFLVKIFIFMNEYIMSHMVQISHVMKENAGFFSKTFSFVSP